MFVLINLSSMAVLHRHADVRVLRNLAHIECVQRPTSIFEESDVANYRAFEDGDLKDLYEKASGLKCPACSRNTLILTISVLLETIEQTLVNTFELMLHAGQIKNNDLRSYKYVIGSKTPEEINAATAEIARVGCLQRAKVPTPQPAAHAAPAPVKTAAWAIDPAAPPLKIPPPWAKK